MKKLLFSAAFLGLGFGSAFAQPVSDRAVIPVAVTLNQILRIHVTNGGNIEFVFNTIDQYKNGMANSAFYTTDVVVASSTQWELDMGAEDANLVGTDNPANTMTLDNVGFTADWTGGNTCCGAALDVTSTAATCDYNNSITAAGAPGTANALIQYTGQGTALLFSSGAAGNGGDVLDNAFSILWECGTQVPAGTQAMNAVSILDQNITPDRYVTNVLLELTAI